MDDTIVAVASAAGGAGRGILRLSGCDVVQVLRACFDSPDATALDRSVAWCTEGNLHVAAPLRRVPCLLYLWPDQRSHTRQPSAEIHTLGSPPLLDACLQALCAAGARLARPGEFTLRAFLAGRLDLTQAEAVLGVIEAVSQRQLEVALTQLAGGLSARLQAAREQLLNLCADVEAGLDFVDEDLQFISPAEIARQLAEVDRALDHALQQMDSRGERSPQPRVVLTGRPNVGKSTLWNRLLHHHAALVSAAPGTTRDYLEDRLELGTTQCTLVDTAGVDPTAPTSAVERAAQEMTRRNQQQADLIVLCLDSHQPLARCELEQLQSPDRPTVFVLTKCDDPASSCLTSWIASLPPAVDVVDQPNVVRLKFAGQRPADLQVLKVSSHTGAGLPQLLAALQQHVAERDESESSVVAATATRCRESLRLAHAAVSQARETAAISAGDELLAVEIRCALDELGKILGTVYTDDILDRIFRRFCIGK